MKIIKEANSVIKTVGVVGGWARMKLVSWS